MTLSVRHGLESIHNLPALVERVANPLRPYPWCEPPFFADEEDQKFWFCFIDDGWEDVTRTGRYGRGEPPHPIKVQRPSLAWKVTLDAMVVEVVRGAS